MTTSVGAFAFSYIYNTFFVPGSCPFDISMINLPILAKLDVKDGSLGLDVKPKDQHLTFTAELSAARGAEKFLGHNGKGMYLTYFSGQLLPISENVMKGFSVAALTTSNNFTAPGMVPGATTAAAAVV